MGYQAGYGVEGSFSSNSANLNVAVGYQAGYGFTTGYQNVLIGVVKVTNNHSQNNTVGICRSISRGYRYS